MASARELRDCLRAIQRRSGSAGERLTEGAARVLGKLDTVRRAGGLCRAYVKTGGRAVMWDLVHPEELCLQGYVVTRRRAYIESMDSMKRDRVACWINESDPAGEIGVGELWVGEPLTA